MTIFEFACVMATVAFVCVLIAASHSYGADRSGCEGGGEIQRGDRNRAGAAHPPCSQPPPRFELERIIYPDSRQT